jgi:probable phosphoglycerate mutase
MTHLYLIRHGDYYSTDEEGHLVDDGLNEMGVQQSERLRERLTANSVEFDVLISSTMLRAQQTANIIAPVLNLPITLDSQVEEWRNTDGEITVQEFSEKLRAVDPEQRVFMRPVPTAETWTEFMHRACAALNRITQEYDGQKIVIVCHGGIVEAAFMLFCEFSIMQAPPIVIDVKHTSITHWFLHQGQGTKRWMLVSFNDTGHLR